MTKPPLRIRLEWKDGLEFRGRAGEAETRIDGEGEAGPSPMSLLLLALASCAGSDVVEILRKGREPLEGLLVSARGERRPQPPHRYTSIRLVFRPSGKVARAKVARAVRLSLEKYCSVAHTMRPDLELGWEVRMGEGDEGG